MPVPFQELGGSPLERYTRDGFRARREFLIAWEDRDAFAAELLGTAAEHGGRTWLPYPGKPEVVAVSLRYEPFEPDSPDLQALTEVTVGLNGYRGSFAKATVEYQTLTAQDREDGPQAEPGTHLTYRMEFALQTQKLLPGGWTWADSGLPAPADLEIVRAVPVTDHLLTWHQVVNPSWEAIRTLQGKLNAGEFLGCPPGTVLFLGAEANKLFRGGFDSEPSNFCWQIAYRFRERAIKHGGQTFGWNHLWRDDPPGWAELTAGPARLYDSGDLSGLFRT